MVQRGIKVPTPTALGAWIYLKSNAQRGNTKAVMAAFAQFATPRASAAGAGRQETWASLCILRICFEKESAERAGCRAIMIMIMIMITRDAHTSGDR